MIPVVRALTPHVRSVRGRFGQWLYDFSTRDGSPSVKRVATNALLLWSALYTLSLLPRHAEFWGDGTPVTRVFNPGDWTHWVTHLANAPGAGTLYLVFVFALLTAVCLALANYRRPLMLLVVTIATLNLHHRCFYIADGGNNLSWILLPLAAAMAWGEGAGRGPLGDLRRSLANGALFVARFQIVAMYATAGLCKVVGEHWQNGTALFHILQVKEYANPVLAPHLVELWPLTIVGAYLTIVFQLTFPFAMLTRRLRFVSMAAGLFLHVNIAVVMGLPSFGAIMCISYLFFLREREARALTSWFSPEPASITIQIDTSRLGGGMVRWLVEHIDDESRLRVLEYGDTRPLRGDETARALDLVTAHTPLRWLRPATAAVYYLGLGRLLRGARIEEIA